MTEQMTKAKSGHPLCYVAVLIPLWGGRAGVQEFCTVYFIQLFRFIHQMVPHWLRPPLNYIVIVIVHNIAAHGIQPLASSMSNSCSMCVYTCGFRVSDERAR